MAFQEQLLQILQGPMVWAATIIFAAGIIGQSIRLYRLTRRTEPEKIEFIANPRKTMKISGWRRWTPCLGQLKTTMLGTSPVLSAVTIIFHICLFITPIFLMGHNVLLKATVGLPLPYFSETTSDLLTLIVLFCGLFFLFRRLLLPRVRVLTTPYDILLLLLAIFPFLTGFLAHHQLLLDYQLMMILHMGFSELLLIMIPFSKFFHMIFFFFGRFFIVNEYSLGMPRRIWQF